MTSFNEAVDIILKHEGGYSNDKRDPGGETNFGISKRSYPHINIKNLTREHAKDIYRKDFWIPLKCENLPYPAALILFDFGVNAGPRTATKALQRACNATADGIIGPNTISMAKSISPKLLAERFTTERMLYYFSLPTFPVYGKGWTRRTIETLSAALSSK